MESCGRMSIPKFCLSQTGHIEWATRMVEWATIMLGHQIVWLQLCQLNQDTWNRPHYSWNGIPVNRDTMCSFSMQQNIQN